MAKQKLSSHISFRSWTVFYAALDDGSFSGQGLPYRYSASEQNQTECRLCMALVRIITKYSTCEGLPCMWLTIQVMITMCDSIWLYVASNQEDTINIVHAETFDGARKLARKGAFCGETFCRMLNIDCIIN